MERYKRGIGWLILKSPLGMLAPGGKELGDFFDGMARDIESKPLEMSLDLVTVIDIHTRALGGVRPYGDNILYSRWRDIDQ